VHEDPTGFAVAVPQGWEVSRDGTRTYLRDRESSRLLLIDQTRDPEPDPAADWEAQEATVSQRLPGYERVAIEAVDYRGWNAADWEFTWDGDNGRVHVRNRGVVTGPDRAYALYWAVPDSQWQDNEEVFDAIAASFRPAS
jgi:eukaryotic-like serine/threonine-protein kinase